MNLKAPTTWKFEPGLFFGEYSAFSRKYQLALIAKLAKLN